MAKGDGGILRTVTVTFTGQELQAVEKVAKASKKDVPTFIHDLVVISFNLAAQAALAAKRGEAYVVRGPDGK